jgi:paraquat-inducible protein B
VKTKLSPSLVGLFVLGALLLAGVGVVTFGNVSIFTKPPRFTVFFDESVHGLDMGSAVKFRGVRVGRVADIRVRYDVATRRSEVQVICELSRDTIADPAGGAINMAERKQLEKFVREGLRARLGVVGLATGLLFVELDFFNPQQYPAAPPTFADDTYARVPAVRSTIAEFQASLTDILAKLKDVDIAALARETTGFVSDARRQLNALDLPQLASESTQTVRAVRNLATDPVWLAAAANANGAITDLRGVIAKIDGRSARRRTTSTPCSRRPRRRWTRSTPPRRPCDSLSPRSRASAPTPTWPCAASPRPPTRCGGWWSSWSAIPPRSSPAARAPSQRRPARNRRP